jgi:outer membrane protein assembly factor BamB
MFRLHVATLVTAAGVILLAVGALSDAATRPAFPDRSDDQTSLPTTPSGRHVIAGGMATPGTMLRVGNTVYVGGAFSRIANRTGSAIVVPGSGGAPEPGFPEVASGSVSAAVADGAGGWYLGGSFTNVRGVSRHGLAHVRGDGVLDAAFAPDALGEVHALALAGKVLYAGGVQSGTAPAPVLSALDATTGADLPVTFEPPADALNVVALVPNADRLYVAFRSKRFGSSVVAFDAATGLQIWVHSFSFDSFHEGPATLALDGTRLLVGGEFSDAGNENLEALDVSTGTPTAPSFQVSTAVTSIAVVGNEIYVARYRSKRASSGLDVIDSATGLGRSWGLIRAEQLAASGSTLYVAGRTAADERQGVRDRVYSTRTGTATALLHAVSPQLGGEALTLVPQGGRLFVGGTFSGVGGVARANLAAFDVRTGKLLPWRPSADSVVTGIAATHGKVYIGGYFRHVGGKTRRGLAAVAATGAGRLLPWRPGLSYSSAVSLAIGHGRVFVGGTFVPQGQKRTPGKPIRFTHLAAFSASGPGARIRFASHPLNTASGGALSGGGVLAVRGSTLLLAEPSGVAAFSVDGDGRHELWRKPVNGPVRAFATSGATLYLGGRFSRVSGKARSNLARLALDRRGALLPFAPAVTREVGALAPLRGVLVYGVATLPIPRPAWHQALGAVAPDGTILPWRFDTDGSVDCIAPFSGGLAVAGSFDWLGPTGHQAAGRFGWLR